MVNFKGGAYTVGGGVALHHTFVCVCLQGMFPQVKLIRPYENASQAVGDRHNHTTFWQLECNSGTVA